MEKLKHLEEGDVLVLAGSIPESLPNSIYRDILAELQGKGILFVVDATKDLLLYVLEYEPFLIKPNNHELGEIFDVELKTRESVIPYAKKLQEKGARNVLVSIGWGRRRSCSRKRRSIYAASTERNISECCRSR